MPCRDAANRWLFPEVGTPWSGVNAVYVAAASSPTHYVDVSETVDAGIESLCAHRAYLDGLGNDFDPDTFLRGQAATTGSEVGCTYRDDLPPRFRPDRDRSLPTETGTARLRRQSLTVCQAHGMRLMP